MTSDQIRQSFLDFFASKQHAIVPSSSLMPDAPNLLFTNAGMNQFVPYFLGDREAPYPRAADTQKCIRAGGKHNDLEDVGLDTYHHTFFEMLGNWSFGDYFKKDAIEWAWELVTEVWKFPKNRLYASVYKPKDGDPASFDQEAYDFWKAVFEKAGLDPAVHIVFGGKKDNFWMMGDTGPCGPCSELHVDLTPAGDSKGKLVNADSPYCIEIWNLVFIQFNATPEGDFVPLKNQHVDTGMGFERVAGIVATSKGFTDFSSPPSNYNSDLFDTLFQKLTELSGHRYQRTLPADVNSLSDVEQKDVIFRVLADHARCLSCAIADGILPGNEGRNYVLRRILRRAVMYGRKLNLEQGFFASLVPIVVAQLGHVFPELKKQQSVIERVIRSEEESFGKTLDRGIARFNEGDPATKEIEEVLLQELAHPELNDGKKYSHDASFLDAWRVENPHLANIAINAIGLLGIVLPNELENIKNHKSAFSFGEILSSLRDDPENQGTFANFIRTLRNTISGQRAFELYDTYGFPLDLTQLLAKQKGIAVDTAGFEIEMDKQRAKAKAGQKKAEVLVAERSTDVKPTEFVGFKTLADEAELIDVVTPEKSAFSYLVFTHSPFYAEMGGQVGDTGHIEFEDRHFEVLDTVKDANGRFLHKVSGDVSGLLGQTANLIVDVERRHAIERHHSATHVLHWALRKVLGTHVRQAGSYVGPDRLRFDFAHFEAIKPDQLAEIERLCNQRLLENGRVEWFETPFDQKPADVIAFFGEKYGDVVRVVNIGGFSKELCGGTHVRGAGEIGLLKIVQEAAIAAGTRRIEAIVGEALYQRIKDLEATIANAASALSVAPAELAKKIDSLLVRQSDLEKQLKRFQQQASGNLAEDLVKTATDKGGQKLVKAVVDAEDPNALRQLGSTIIGKLGGEGIVVLGAAINGKSSVVAFCGQSAIAAGHKAGDIIRDLAAKLDGRGGGKPDFAMGGGANTEKLRNVIDAF